MQCNRCGSRAINPHMHGRKKGADLELCDVCYWRKRTEELLEVAEAMKLYVEHFGDPLKCARTALAKLEAPDA